MVKRFATAPGFASALRFAAALMLAAQWAHAADEPVTARIELPTRPVWAGEVFDLSLDIRAQRAVFRNLEGTPAWDSGPLVAVPWSRPVVRNDDTTTLMRFTASALALHPGTLTLLPATQSVVIQTGTEKTAFADRAIMESVVLRSTQAPLTVRALPAPPADFSGAVGKFELSSEIDTGDAQVGHGILWRLTLKGRGNWPHIRGLPPRPAPRSFEVAGRPQVHSKPGANLFEREMQESVTLVPRAAGKFSLGPAQVVVFDPAQGEYVRLTAPAVVVDVAATSPADETGATPAAADDLPATTATEDAVSKPKKFEIPAPLAGSASALRPLPSGTWHAMLLAPAIPLAAFWLLLVWLRVRREDPVLIARRAHRSLEATLARLMQAAGGEQQRALLRSWERLVAALLGRGEAAPVFASFSRDGALLQLSSEADVALYGRKGALPLDWSDRARAWRAALPLPQPKPRVPSELLREWLPPLLALIVGCLAVLGAATAATPTDWQARVASEPRDWVARYNLAIDRATESKYDEAAAQAAIAWLQRPQHTATRNLWQRLAERAEFARPEIGGIARPFGPGATAFATLATPARWRWIAFGMAVLIAVGAGAFLSSRYGFAPRKVRGASIAVVGVAAAVLATAVLASRSYGVASEPTAVLLAHPLSLRSVPVESTALEQRPPLPSGVAAVVTKRFLDWLHLRLTDGREGWLREEQVLWIWGPADLD